jgi:hypothetical protein
VENRINPIFLAVIPSAPAHSIDSRSLTRAGAVCGWWILLVAVTVMAGCGNERDPARGPAAGRAGKGYAPAETYWAGERDTLRTRTDAARNRLWVLGLDDVRVFDTVKKRLIRKIVLPNWSVARFICDPDMVLDSSGSAIISSNVQARLWRIDADSFEVKEHEISLHGREQWDTGFGALAFAADGALYALTSSAGSLWKIDVAKASASMIEPNNPPSRACAFTTQFLRDFERSRKPWTRPSPQQN